MNCMESQNGADSPRFCIPARQLCNAPHLTRIYRSRRMQSDNGHPPRYRETANFIRYTRSVCQRGTLSRPIRGLAICVSPFRRLGYLLAAALRRPTWRSAADPRQIKTTVRRTVAMYNAMTRLFRDVRQQRHDSRAFDRFGKHSLVLRANAAHSSGQDFALFGNEFAQFRNVFVIDFVYLIHAENANLFAGHSLRGAFGNNFFFAHSRTLLIRMVIRRLRE